MKGAFLLAIMLFCQITLVLGMLVSCISNKDKPKIRGKWKY